MDGRSAERSTERESPAKDAWLPKDYVFTVETLVSSPKAERFANVELNGRDFSNSSKLSITRLIYI